MMSTPTRRIKRKKVSRNNWSPKDLLLIKLISRQPAIYNTKLKFAGGKTFYKNVWESVAQDMGRDVTECKKRWKNLRDCYIKSRKMFRIGNQRAVNSKWLDGTLSFLDGVLEKKQNWDETVESVKEVESPDSDNCINISDDSTTMSIEYDSNLETNAIPMGHTTLVTQDMIESLLQQKTQGSSDMDDVPLVNEIIYKKLDETIDKHTQPTSDSMLYPNVASVHSFGPSISEAVMNLNTKRTLTSSLAMTNTVNIDILPEYENNLYPNLDRPSTSQENMNTMAAPPENVANNQPRPVTPQTLPVITKSESIPEEQKTLANESINYRDEHTETFFNEIGAFVSSRFTLKKQSEIRMKVLSLVTNAELETLEENEET